MDTPQFSQPQDSVYENDLIPAEAMGEIAAMDDKQIALVSSSNAFLPRLQLFGGNSDACKEGKIPIGHYGIVRGKDSIEALGPEVDLLVVTGRPKALRITDDAIISKYDPLDEEFKKIMTDSETPNSGCMYGPDFLVYIPSAKTFATFFMSSKTARRVAPQVAARQKKAATLTAELIKTKKYSWHGPICTPCSAQLHVPTLDEIKEANVKFLASKDTDVETVGAEAGAGRAR